jgi:hypothetical protein
MCLKTGQLTAVAFCMYFVAVREGWDRITVHQMEGGNSVALKKKGDETVASTIIYTYMI